MCLLRVALQYMNVPERDTKSPEEAAADKEKAAGETGPPRLCCEKKKAAAPINYKGASA